MFRWAAPALLLIASSAVAADQPVVPLWPGGAPGSEGKTDPEKLEQGYQVSSVHKPSLNVYLPSKETATGAAVVVIPGGGHRYLAIEHEGFAVAKWLADHGIAGFVLKYRLAREAGSTYQVETHALQDTQRAVRLVRQRAREWGVDPARVGVLGFSAGGQLAALASVRHDAGQEGATDPVDRQSSRPDFQALLYPAIPQDMKLTKETPPAFLVCGYNDRQNISEGLASLYLAFKQAGASAELHVYAGAGHGFGLRETNKSPAGAWLDRFREWLGGQKLLDKKP